MSSWQQFLRAWLVVLGYLVYTFLLVGLLIVTRERIPLLVAVIFFIVFELTATLVVIFLMWVAISPGKLSAQYEASQHGLPGTAQVLEINWTGWRERRNAGKWLEGQFVRSREYRLRLRVAPPQGENYEVTMFIYLKNDELPERGAQVAVKIHPQRPEIVVLAGSHDG
jgi:hypothetical protein